MFATRPIPLGDRDAHDDRTRCQTDPASERHDRIHDEFAELEPGETLTIVNDHEPTPLYHEMAAEVPAFDADGYAVEREEASRFVAEFPKVGPSQARSKSGSRISTASRTRRRSPGASRRRSDCRWTPARAFPSTPTPTGRCCSTR